MTFHPSDKRQRDWVDRYFNGGVCPESRAASLPVESACYDALEWLSEQDDVRTLADAWDKCPRVDWLIWMYVHMQPSKKDVRQWLAMAKKSLGMLNKPGVSKDIKQSVWSDWEYIKNAVETALKPEHLRVVDYDYMLEDCVGIVEDVLHNLGMSLQHDLLKYIHQNIPNPWVPKKQRKKR